MDNLLTKAEQNLMDFYNNSKSIIVSENLLTFLTSFLEKENFNYLPFSIVENGYLLAYLKDCNVVLEEEEKNEVEKQKHYYVFVDKKFDVTKLPFSFSLIDLTNKENPLEIII